MKKVAILTAAVLALGLAACNKNNADNNAANETAVENTASTDVNAATGNDVTANADAALNATGNDTTANAAGNTTNDGLQGYTFDAEERVGTTNGITYKYDGGGTRAQSTSHLYWYSVSGEPLEEAENMLNASGANEEGPADRSTGPPIRTTE